MFRSSKVEAVPFRTSRTGMSLLLLGLVVVLLPHIAHLPVWTSLTCFSLLMWRLLGDMRRLALPNKFVIFLLFVLITLGVLASYLTIVGREAGTALLISLICLKLFEIKSLRDITVIVQLAFFAIVVTFLFSQSILVALSMLLAVILLVAALISFQHAKSGDTKFNNSVKMHIALSIKMVLYAIPLSIIIFILFPRTDRPLWGLPQDAFSATTGLSNKMSPGDISNLVNSHAVAFRVQFQSSIPRPAQRYWRGPVFWAFDGHTWTAPLAQRRIIKNISLANPSQPIKYSVTLEPDDNDWMFALDQPGLIPKQASLTAEMQLIAHKPINHLKRYNMLSYLKYDLPWVAGIAPERYLQVPADAAPRARRYIKLLQKKHLTKLGIVNAILKLFSDKQYYYTRHPPPLVGDPTDSFLFDTKRGYCEQFASSFTVLMRLAGIPARVVTGYQGGVINPLGHYMIVRQSDAHAWSEIYLKGKGWLRIDPTAAVPESNIENANDAIHIQRELFGPIISSNSNWLTRSLKDVFYAWDMVNHSWNQWVIGYSNRSQKSIFRAMGIPEITWRGLSYTMFTLLAVLTLVMAVTLFRKQRIKIEPVDKIYQKFLRKLRPLHIEKHPSEGVIGFSRRVAARLPDLEPDLIRIAELYNYVRYAQPKDNTIEELHRAVSSICLKRMVK